MNMKPIVIGIGEFLWDVFPDGRKAGGAPVNFAYHASQNGAEGWAVSAVGDDDLGHELMSVTGRCGIHALVPVVNKPTGTVNVEVKDGQPSYVIREDVAWDYIPLTEEMLSLARRAGAISFGTLAQRSPVSRRTTHALIKALPEDAYIIFDINLRQNFYTKDLIQESLRLANVLKINDEELVILRGMFGLPENDEASCRKLMEEYNLRMLVLTAGSRFSSIYTGDAISTLPTPKVKVVDTVGAGDSFSGSLIASLLTGKSVGEAHRTAVDTAAYVCTCPGAWPPPRR